MKQEILSWINGKEYWFQLLSHYLINSSSLTGLQKEEVYNILLSKYQMTNYDFEEVDLNSNINSVDNSSSVSTYFLQSVKNINGVNALHKQKSKMILDRNLTIIYGENGSGKSGFTRLYNLVFKSNGDSNILPDIYSDSDSKIISANFIFKNNYDSQIIDLQYPDYKNNKLFNQTSVFDSTSSYRDVSEENEMTILPLEFDYFVKIISVIDEIRNILNNEIKVKSKENDFVEYFNQGTEVHSAITSLDEHLDYDKLNKISKVTINEDAKYKENKKKRKELEALNIEEKSIALLEYKTNILRIQKNIGEIEKQLNNKIVQDLLDYEQNIVNLEKASKDDGASIFDNDNISSLGSEEWLTFIKSFNNYAQKIKFNAEICVLCNQPIEDKEIFDKYIKYIESTVEEKLASSKKNKNRLLLAVKELSLNMINNDQKIYDWMKKNCNGILESLLEYQRNIAQGRKEISDYFNTDKEKNKLDQNIFDADLPNLEEALTILKKQIISLNQEKNDEEIKTLIMQENEYSDKKILASKLDDIKEYITNKKWIESANKIKRNELSTSSITRFSNKLFEEIVTEKYIETFEQECKKLNVNFPIEITTKGSKGSTLSKIIINSASDEEIAVSKILSEGEQKTVSLANFFAENLVDDQNNTIILDDPVSSLDHKKRDRIAKRIVEISKEKQVVVFTHDLVFMSDLQEYAKKFKAQIKLTNIKKIKDKSGIFYDKSPFTTLSVDKRIEHFEREIKSLNGTLKKAEEDYDAMLIESYKSRAKSMCEELRETWERSVEEILLNKTVLRYRNSVETSRLNGINFNPEAVKMIEEGMTETSAMVHDIASAKGDTYPSIKELEQMIENFREYINIINKKS